MSAINNVDPGRADVVIVGGGSAGGVLAISYLFASEYK